MAVASIIYYLVSVLLLLTSHAYITVADLVRHPRDGFDIVPSPLPFRAAHTVFIVYMGSVSSTTRTAHRDVHMHMLSQVLGSAKAAEEAILYSYTKSFNGFAAAFLESHAKLLKEMDGVVSVFPTRTIQPQTTSTWGYLGLNPTEGLWPQSSFGADTIVGLIDTGVWPESKSFQDDGMGPVPSRWNGTCVKSPQFGPGYCNKKLIGGKFYLKGYEAATAEPVKGPIAYRSPRDSEGHGTHTASTATGRQVGNASFYGIASGVASGGAPLARLAVYKVCWGSFCNEADILAAFDDSIADGVDLLSVSLGSGPSDYQLDSIAIGSFHAVAKGILVSASAGNAGPSRGIVSNTSPWIFTVGASTINRQFLAKVHLGNGESYEGVAINTFKLEKEMYPLVFGGAIPAAKSNILAATWCVDGSLDKVQAKGKIVVCYMGPGVDFSVSNVGGAGVIIIDDVYKQVAFSYSIAASSVGQLEGNAILKYINSTRSPQATIDVTEEIFNAAPSPVAAFFSSVGPNAITPNMLKPDITAPGVDIIAAWSPVASPSEEPNDERAANFNIISGTSMSCPHVTGAAALIKSVHPEWSPAAIKSALMTTANPLNVSINVDAGLASGSGMIDPTKAADPGLVYDMGTKDYLLFMCSIGYTSKKIQLVSGDKFACPKSAPTVLDMNFPSIFVSSNLSMSETRTAKRTVTNIGPLAKAQYSVSYITPPYVDITITPPVLSFTALNEQLTFTVGIKVHNTTANYNFGSIVWSDGTHSVRIPIGVGPPPFFPEPLVAIVPAAGSHK